MRQNNSRKNERGIALILSLLALLLITAVGLGLMYMSSTEGSINSNYKDTQTAFFAMRAGLEEGRDRLRANATFPLPLPTGFPPAAGSVVYIVNPAGATDTVQPWSTTAGNLYFDDEFCHESFVGSGVAWQASGTACGTTGAVPAASYVSTPSESPYFNTANAMKYKWVRITWKQNATTGNPGVPASWTDSTQPANAQVCFDGSSLKETVATSYGAAYTTCALAKNAGFNAMPVYLITSMALTPQGSRRIGQYEAGAFMVTPPQAGLDFAGPGAQFNSAPNSTNFGINGNNSGDPANTGLYQPWNGPGGQASCPSTTPAVLPAIAVGDAAGAANMVADIPSNRTGMYTGSTPIPPAPLVPSVQNEGTSTAQYPSNNLLGPTSNWSTPAQLNQLAQAMANNANIICPGNAACSGTTFGTDASPRITYFNGDATVSGGAGVLVVTGTLTFNGNTNFDGLIMVIGQGVMNVHGGGGGQVNGEVLIANTNSHSAPYGQLATLGSPTLNWTGGGSNFIQYNSCWADYGSFINYQLIASREEMY
jgi:Tfp pilus assembly protein PilX